MTKGCIVLHGLTGTPSVVAPLAEGLGRAGFKVVAPLLAGHGTKEEDLAKASWEDWYKNVSDAYNELLKKGADQIFCAGLSLGALLALKLALNGKRLAGIACIATPLRLPLILERLLIPVSHVPPVRWLLKNSNKDWEASVADEAGREIYRSASYPRIPVHSVWELQKLQEDIIKELPCLDVPALLVHSRRDTVAPPFNVDIFCRLVRIRPKVLWLKQSHHVAVLDLEKEILTEGVVQFFNSQGRPS